MARYNPFGGSTKSEFAAIGTPETGIIFLEKRGKLRVKENPVDLQLADRRQAEMIALIGEATSRLAKAKKITEDEANKLLFPQSAVGAIPTESLTDWLEFGEKAKFYEINATTSSKYKVATLFIRHRLGYHVTIAQDAQPKAGDLSIEPLRWDLAIGAIIQFDGFRVQLIEAAKVDDERIYIKPLPQLLTIGSSGFVVNPDTNSPMVGMPSWNDEATQDLDESQVDAIFAFYQSESAGKNVTEGKAIAPAAPTSESSSIPNPLIGSTAISESNPTESQIPDSTSPILTTATVI